MVALLDLECCSLDLVSALRHVRSNCFRRDTEPFDREWAKLAVLASTRWQNAAVVYEKNFGDEMVGSAVRSAAKDLGVKVTTIPVEATADKVKRAMIVSPLVQKGMVRLIGYFGQLEKQLTTWQPGSGKSPDRLDAFVWAGIHLLMKQSMRGVVV